MTEDLFYLAVGTDVQDRVRGHALHLHLVRAGEVITGESGLVAGGFGVKEGEEPAVRFEYLVEAVYDGLNKGLRDVIERVPEEHDVEMTTGEVEIGVEEAVYVNDRVYVNDWGFGGLVGTGWMGPVRARGFFDEVRHVDAVAELGYEVDVAGGGWAYVQDAEALRAAEVAGDLGPAAGVALGAGGVRANAGGGGFAAEECHGRVLLWGGARLLSGELDAALDAGALLDGKSAGDDVAVEDGGLAKLDAAGGMDVAVDDAEEDEIADVEVSGDAGVGADGEAAFAQCDGALKRAVEKEIFIARELSADADRFADQRGTFCWFHACFVSHIRRLAEPPYEANYTHSGARRQTGKLAGNLAHLSGDGLEMTGTAGRGCGMKAGVAALLLLGCAPAVSGRAQGSDPLSAEPRAWAVDAANNELEMVDFHGVYLRYRTHSVGSRGDLVRDVVESRDGTVARLVSKENRALTADEDAAERERLQAMLDSPAAFQRHVREDDSGKKLVIDLVKLMPDAMLFSYVAGQPQRPGAAGQDVVMDFRPNPDWHPPTLASEGLTGFEGRVWIDVKTHHVTRVEGTVFRPVNLGFGVLAHINPGGHVAIEQVEAADGRRWIFSRFDEDITLRALMVKTIHEQQRVEASGFTQVPALSYQEAVKLLLATPLAK